MALVKVPVDAAGPTVTPPKQIVFNMENSPTIGTIVYAVPTGRKFEGFYVTSAGTQYIQINGLTVQPPAGLMISLTLLAGTTVGQGTNYGNARLLGVESAA